MLSRERCRCSRFVLPGTLDRRVLSQAHYWITADGQILELIRMSRDHLCNVLEMLSGVAVLLHIGAMLDVLLGDPGDLAAEVVTYQLTGSSLASVSPQAWLESTALVRSLQRLLDDWDVVDGDPWAGCARPPGPEVMQHGHHHAGAHRWDLANRSGAPTAVGERPRKGCSARRPGSRARPRVQPRRSP